MHRTVSYRFVSSIINSGVIDENPPSQIALLRSCVAGDDPRDRSRRRHRYACCRDQSRHIAVPDGLRGRHWWVLHDLLTSRCAQSPVRAHVVRVFRQEKRCSCVASLEAEGHVRTWQPDTSVNIRVFIFAILRAAIIHDFHFPTCGEISGDDFHTCFQRQSLQIFKSEERAAADVLHDDAGTTSLEFPLLVLPPVRPKGDRRPIVRAG